MISRNDAPLPRPLCAADQAALRARFVAHTDPDRRRAPDNGLALVLWTLAAAVVVPLAAWVMV